MQDAAALALDWLQRKPDIAEAVLTAPLAHQSSKLLSLAQLYVLLPDTLHAAAARGYFGAAAAEWWLDVTTVAAQRASKRTLQLLPEQRHVTHVRMTRYDGGPQILQALFVGVARAHHLTAFSMGENYTDGSDKTLACPWLRHLTSLTEPQHLNVLCARCASNQCQMSQPH